MKVDVSDIDMGPTKEQEIAAAQRVVKGSMPLISEAPPALLTLPRGLLVGDRWENTVELRELTGVDEETLARFKDPLDFFDGVIVLGTSRIGSQDLSQMSFAERQSTLLNLLIGEREQLFLHVARTTYGDEKEITHTCPFCATEQTTTVVLSEDIEIPEMEQANVVIRNFTAKNGDVLSYRLATGVDQVEAVSIKGASNAEQNTRIIAQCVVRINDAPVLDPLTMARNLTMGDRDRLLNLLVSDQPTPKMSLDIKCASCREEVILPVTWGDIFRP